MWYDSNFQNEKRTVFPLSIQLNCNHDFQMTLHRMLFENIMGKGENAGNQHFLLFPIMFPILSRTKFFVKASFILSSANAFNLDQAKILSFGEELTGTDHTITYPLSKNNFLDFVKFKVILEEH